MPVTRTSFLRTTSVLLVLGLVALIIIVATTIWLVERTQTYFDEVVEAREARTATVELRSALQDAEVGQRGYLLTLDERYLEPYEAARERIMPAFERLEEVLAPYPQADQPVENLREGLDIKLAELEETIALARDGRVEEAIAIVRTDRGKQIMDEARLLFDGVIRAADERLEQGVQSQRDSADLLFWTALAGGFAILLVAGGAVWTALSYTRDLVLARGEVDALNVSLEARVAERTQDLQRANDEVQRFAYIVTHDLRAPLVNIMGFTAELDETMKTIQAYVMADGPALGEQAIREARVAASEDLPEAIGFIRSSTRKMDGLINAILKISRDGKRPLKPETIDLEAMLRSNLDAVGHQIFEAGGSTHLDVAVPRIVSDRISLEQIVGNLIDNAVKYRAKDRPLDLRISTRRLAGAEIAIEIADNGRGIAREDHERVFDLFRRAGEQDQKGEGIGLAHVRTLVRSLGGDIALASQAGVGSTFTITLPVDVRTAMRNRNA